MFSAQNSLHVRLFHLPKNNLGTREKISKILNQRFSVTEAHKLLASPLENAPLMSVSRVHQRQTSPVSNPKSVGFRSVGLSSAQEGPLNQRGGNGVRYLRRHGNDDRITPQSMPTRGRVATSKSFAMSVDRGFKALTPTTLFHLLPGLQNAAPREYNRCLALCNLSSRSAPSRASISRLWCGTSEFHRAIHGTPASSLP